MRIQDTAVVRHIVRRDADGVIDEDFWRADMPEKVYANTSLDLFCDVANRKAKCHK